MNNKRGIIVLIIMAIMVAINLVSLVREYIYLEDRQEAGNRRWEQVEDRIVEIENRLEELENGRNG